MYDKAELCNKIHEIYPEIGNCDKDLKVAWDSDRNVWEVNFEKDGQTIRNGITVMLAKETNHYENSEGKNLSTGDRIDCFFGYPIGFSRRPDNRGKYNKKGG